MPHLNRHPITFVNLIMLCVLCNAGLSACGSMAPGERAKNGRSTQSAERTHAAEKREDQREAIRDYSYAQRSDLIATLELQVAAAEAELVVLDAKLEEREGEARVQLAKSMEELRLKVAAAKEDLATARSASEDEWDALRGRIQATRNDLEDAGVAARQWLSDAIEPD